MQVYKLYQSQCTKLFCNLQSRIGTTDDKLCAIYEFATMALPSWPSTAKLGLLSRAHPTSPFFLSPELCDSCWLMLVDYGPRLPKENFQNCVWLLSHKFSLMPWWSLGLSRDLRSGRNHGKFQIFGFVFLHYI